MHDVLGREMRLLVFELRPSILQQEGLAAALQARLEAVEGRGGLVTDVVPRSPSDQYAPSADRMMVSVAEASGPAALGVVLTGMGKDGSEGALAIKKRRGQCLAESEESAVIFGMPQEAIRTGAVDKVLPLSKMAAEIALRCGAPKTSS